MVHSLYAVRRIPLLSLSSFLAHYVGARSVNRTIDNFYGDSDTGLVPAYLPRPWSEGDQCPGCHAQPDSSQAFRGTWSDTTHHGGDPESEARVIKISFTGTAVYAYNIIANYIQWTDTLTNLSFVLDGKDTNRPYVHSPTSSTDYEYNVNVFTQENLENTGHVLEIHGVGDTTPSLILFDYAIYTFIEPDLPPLAGPSPSPSPITTSSSSSSSSSSSPSPSSSTSSSLPPTSSVSQSTHTTSSTSPSSRDSTGSQAPYPIPVEGTTTISVSPSITSAPKESSTADTAHNEAGIPLGMIIGSAVGGAVLILLVAALIICFLRRRRRARALIPPAARSSHPPTEMLSCGSVEKTSTRGVRTPRRWRPRQRARPKNVDASSSSSPALLTFESSSPLVSAPVQPATSPPSESITAFELAFERQPDSDAKVDPDVREDSPATPAARMPAASRATPSTSAVRHAHVSVSDQTLFDDSDARTEYTYFTSSDGTVSRLRTEVAELRQEVIRLRQGRNAHHEQYWDDAPPQYQSGVFQ